MRVVLAPDSFKGTVSATDAVEALRHGWLAERPGDELICLPMADGGEGTLAVLARTNPDATFVPMLVSGPGGAPVEATWLLLADGTAVVEAATACGLPLLAVPDPLGASTRGLGSLLADAAAHPDVRRVIVGLGGTATTDGGTGALTALGARFLDENDDELPSGGGALRRLATVDLSGTQSPPPDGVTCLIDVDAPLLGPRGAATSFGPQKGAAADDVLALESGLGRLARLLGGRPQRPGAGSAGGTAYGLASVWRAELAPGAATLAGIAGLPQALDGADVVVTGEGRFDVQSLRGKVVGHVIDAARRAGVVVYLVAGALAGVPPPEVTAAVDLTMLAGDRARALAQADRLLGEAGRRLAARVDTVGVG